MRRGRRITRNWTIAVSAVAHVAIVGGALARFEPEREQAKPPKLEIQMAAPTLEPVTAAPVEEVVAALAERPEKVVDPEPVRAVEPTPVAPLPEPELVKTTALDAPVVAHKPTPRKRPEPVPERKPEPPKPVRQAMVVPAPRPAPPVPVAPSPAPTPVALPAPSLPAGPPPDYLGRIRAQLERCKQYPISARMRRIEGDVILSFVMDRSGRVLDHRIARSSGYAMLDQAVDAMIRKASPLPPMPASMTQGQIEISVPIRFQLR